MEGLTDALLIRCRIQTVGVYLPPRLANANVESNGQSKPGPPIKCKLASTSPPTGTSNLSEDAAVHKSATDLFVGIDVAKDEVVVARSDRSTVQRVGNTLAALESWIADLPGPCAVLMESTGRYHQLLAETLHAAGHRVYLVNGLKLSQYRKSVGQRAKTDPSDARLLLRYLQHEHAALTPWQPAPENISAIRTLLKRRSEVIKHTVALRQSFSDLDGSTFSSGRLPHKRGISNVGFDMNLESVMNRILR